MTIRLLTYAALPAILLAAAALAAEHHSIVHRDCLDHPQPQLCTDMVNDLLEELDLLNQALQPSKLDEFAAYYHERAVLFTAGTGRFFRGRDEIRKDFIQPLFSGVKSATVDIQQFRFSVINPRVIVTYGSPSSVVVMPNGQVIQLPPLPQTLTWVRNEGFDRKRPFLIVSDQE